jgi:hypothetical protein
MNILRKFREFWLGLAGRKQHPNFSTNTVEIMNLNHIWRDGDDAPIVAVAVGRMPQGHTHTGIVYREGDDGEGLHLAHLAFHLVLADEVLEKPTNCRAWKADIISVVPKIDIIDAIQVAIHCRGIIRSNPKLPYGLSYQEDGYFEITEGRAELMIPHDRKWLNCSTFVLTVFKSAGIPLIDASVWPARPDEDREWQAKLVEMLQNRASLEHIEKVRPDIGKARIRPEETAGSCLEDHLPARFEQCEQNGKILLELIDGQRSLPPRESHGPTDGLQAIR